MTCVKCRKARAIYNVLTPLPRSHVRTPHCPSCFQKGLDAGKIVWIGPDPVGVSTEDKAA